MVVGLALTQLGRLAVADVPLDGGPFGVADLGVPGTWMAGVAVVAVLVAVVATLTGLKAVRASPLGVVRPAAGRRPSVLRVVGLGVVLVAFGVAAAAVGAGGAVVVLMGALAALIAGVGLVGPWFTWLLGWVTARRAARATTLLAGRSITADPIGAFRPATPIVFSAFVGGCLLVVSGTTALLGQPGGDPLTMVVEQAGLPAVTQALADAGVLADVGVAPFGPGVAVTVADQVDLEVARTAVDAVAEPTVPATDADVGAENLALLDDIARGVWLLLVLALVQSAAATAVGASASVLEQGRTLAALRLVGMEPGRMLRVRMVHAAVPVGVIAALSTSLGAGAAWLIVLVSGPSGLLIGVGSVLGPPGVVVAAVVAAVGGAAFAWPVLRDVTSRPLVDA